MTRSKSLTSFRWVRENPLSYYFVQKKTCLLAIQITPSPNCRCWRWLLMNPGESSCIQLAKSCMHRTSSVCQCLGAGSWEYIVVTWLLLSNSKQGSDSSLPSQASGHPRLGRSSCRSLRTALEKELRGIFLLNPSLTYGANSASGDHSCGGGRGCL